MRHILRLAAVAILTVFFLAIFLWKSDLHRVTALLGTVSPGWLALGFTSNLGALLFRAIRWRYILDSARPPRLYATLSSTAIGYMISMLLPVRAADVTRPALLTRHSDIKFSTAFGTVVIERIVDLTAMLSFFLLFVAIYGRHFGGHQGAIMKTAGTVCLAILLTVAVFVVGVYFFTDRIRRVHEAIGRILPARFREGWMQFFDSFTKSLLVVHDRAAFLKIILMTILVWVCLAGQFYFVVLAFDRPLPFLASFFVTGLSILGLIVPTPAGVGGYHKACQIALTTFYAFDVDSSVAIAFVFHLVGVVPVILAGLAFFVHEGLSWKTVTHLAEERESAE